MRRIIIVITLVAMLLSGKVSAQSYFFRNYQVENGLSNNSTICCLQDARGFLWFGTKDGLNRFDGYAFKIFKNDADAPHSIGNNFIHCLYADRQGTLWVGTESGLYRYDAATETFEVIPSTLNTRIRDIEGDAQGNIWFITGFTLVQYNYTKKSIRYFETGRYFEATSISVALDSSLWMSSSTGWLMKYNPATDSFARYDLFAHSPTPASRWIETIYCTHEGAILVGTSNQGAKLFNMAIGSYKDILTYNKDNTEIFVRNFVQVSANEYWIATETGVFIYDLKKGVQAQLQKKLNDPYSLSDNAVYSFCKDKEGGVWVCTYFGGVNYYPRQYSPFKKYFPKIGENSLSGNVVREIHRDRKGNLWIGTEDRGLNKFEPATGRFTHFLPSGEEGSISYSNIHGMLVDGNYLWAGTFEHGLDVLDINTGKVVRHYAMGNGKYDLRSNFIYSIVKTGKNEILLATTRGIYRYNARHNGFNLLRGMPLNNWYTCILKDKSGTLWAGTYGNGVYRYNPATHTARNFRYAAGQRNSLGNDRVNSIFQDSNGSLWFATEEGLCKYQDSSGTFKRYTVKNGLPGNFILSLLEDDQKKLWISTSTGLVCFDITKEDAMTYTVASGILNNQFNFNSALKTPDGTLYFGSVKGMISFNPSGFFQNAFVPPLYITSFQVFHTDLAIADSGSALKRSISFTDTINLEYNQATITIGFAALNYAAPGLSQYAYRMKGLDNNWTYLSRNRSAYFTDLSPGTYIFEVKASNSSGLWNGNVRSLVINILPPWWRSQLAYATYAVATLLILFFAFRSYHRSIEYKNQRRFELLERQKEKEVFKAKIDFFTNVAHEIKTPLTLIKGPLEKIIKKVNDNEEIANHLKIMDRNTNRLVYLSNQLLDFRQTEIDGYRLNFSEANISELIEEAYVGFKLLAEQKNVHLELLLPPAPQYAFIDIDAFSKIIFNLLSNSVKYAESFASITLLAPGDDDSFTVEVRNDGFLIPFEFKDKIFEPFFRLKETQKQKGTGIGLALTLSLVQLHKGTLCLKEQTASALNLFVLRLPVHQDDITPKLVVKG